MPKDKKTLLNFWEDQMRESHTSSNYFFRKSPSHYHMMLLVMSAYKENKKLSSKWVLMFIFLMYSFVFILVVYNMYKYKWIF